MTATKDPKTGQFMTKPLAKPGKGMGQYGSMTTPKLNAKKSKHTIDDISFSKDFIVCTCAWKGAIDAYQPHRKEVEPLLRR